MTQNTFVLKIQRELCHPKSYGSFEKRAPDPQNTGAIPKKKPAKKTQSSNSDDPSASVENLIRLETLRKESLATQL